LNDRVTRERSQFDSSNNILGGQRNGSKTPVTNQPASLPDLNGKDVAFTRMSSNPATMSQRDDHDKVSGRAGSHHRTRSVNYNPSSHGHDREGSRFEGGSKHGESRDHRDSLHRSPTGEFPEKMEQNHRPGEMRYGQEME